MTMTRKEFEAKFLPLLEAINEVLPDPPSDLAMFALALALGERIAEENDGDEEECRACFGVMMTIVQTGTENSAADVRGEKEKT